MPTALYRKLFLFTLLSAFAFASSAQDYTNKGNDFWIGYGNHVMMRNNYGITEKMQLYITSDVNTTGKVEIASFGFSRSFTITANEITTIDIPRTAALMDDGLYNHGIHVTSVKPVVVYSFIYASAVSGATLCLPTATLGRDYFSVNYTQNSNDPNSHNYFFVIAADTGTTSVEITPSADTKGGKTAGVPFVVNLQQGQVYQVLGKLTGTFSGVDLTGSRIRSVNTGSGCKRIAVFCGSGKVYIGSGGYSTSDNFYQQMYPTATWGKKFVAVTGLVNTYNFFRIAKSDPSATVTLNGAVIPAASFKNNFYYEYGTNTPSVIESDKPILVAQYFTTMGNNGNMGNSDPEMIYLNPVEQTINKVTLNSMQPSGGTNINTHFLNIVLKNNAGAINSFKVDGVPYTSFTPVPGDSRYAYARLTTTMGTHNVTCDTGFNIISYGFGSVESYGYSGGTNLKDLYQFISIRNQFATIDFPASCINTPFRFAMTFPYQPTRVKWFFNGLFEDVVVDAPAYDSTWVVNGKQLYQYWLPKIYSVKNIGTYPIKVVAQNPTIDGCTGEQEILYDLQIYDRPKADFIYATTGCLTDTVHFTDNSNTFGRSAYKWDWNFGDGSTASVRNPKYLYKNNITDFPVTFSLITDIGCLSDTVTKKLPISTPPVALFTVRAPYCLGKPITFTDASTSAATDIVKWMWNFGDGTPVVAAFNGNPQNHAYTTSGAFTATLQVESSTGCKSIVYSRAITITPNPVAAFTFGMACLPSGALQFTNTSAISDGTQNALKYTWNFGDGSTGTEVSPGHPYTSTGPFTVSLNVVSGAGCTSDTVQTVNTVYDQPKAAFTVNATELCLGGTFTFTDNSSSIKSPLQKWQWLLGDNMTSSEKNPAVTYASAGAKTVKLVVFSTVGCASDTAVQPLTVHALPAADFSFSGLVCDKVPIEFRDRSAANSGNLVKWLWDFGDGQTAVKNADTSFNHTYTGTQVYTASLQVESDKGCRSAVTKKAITVHPTPQAGYIVPGSCISDPYSQFTDTSKIADGSEARFTYSWNFGDRNATAANPNTSTLKNPRHKYAATDTFYVLHTVVSNAGCRDSVTHKFTVNGAKPVSSFTLTNGQICSNKELELTNNSSVDFGIIIRLDIVWDSIIRRPSVRSTDAYPDKNEKYRHLYPEFYSPASRLDSVYVIAYSGMSCYHGSWQPFALKATPELNFYDLDAVCSNAPSFKLTQAGALNALPGKGIYSGYGITDGNTFNPNRQLVGVDTITYTFTGDNSCTNSIKNTIKVFSAPTANAGPDMYLLEGNIAFLRGQGSGVDVSYSWSPASYLDSANTARPKATPPDDTYYQLTVTTAEGCKATDEMKLTVLKNLRIPNAFSPNGDGVHDRWEIRFLEAYPGATVEIYNRYGQPVYRSNGYGKPWDGTYNGSQMPIGTYYYIINPKNGRQQMSGFVDIIR